MRHAIVASAALLMLSACGSDERASGRPADYATGELPTADTVQRDSEVHVASQQEAEGEEERSR